MVSKEYGIDQDKIEIYLPPNIYDINGKQIKIWLEIDGSNNSFSRSDRTTWKILASKYQNGK